MFLFDLSQYCTAEKIDENGVCLIFSQYMAGKVITGALRFWPKGHDSIAVYSVQESRC